jgi:hypothetical protein
MLALVLVGCQKENVSSEDPQRAKQKTINQLSPQEIKSIMHNGYEFAITCEGSCAGECDFVDTGSKTRECSCDDCHIEVMLVGEGPSEGRVFTDDAAHLLINTLIGDFEDAFLGELQNYLSSYDGNPEVTKYSMVRSPSFFGVRYHLGKDNGTEETVTFTSQGPDYPTYTVTCDGGCDDPTESCRERFIVGAPPQVECTCEGTCAMEISGPTIGE